MKLLYKQIKHLLGYERKKIPYLVILFLISSSLDLVGLGLVGPYVAIIVNPESMEKGLINDLISYLGLPIETNSLLIWLGMTLSIVFLVKAVISILINHTIVIFSNDQQVRLRSYLMQAYQNIPYEEYLKRNSAEYVMSIHDYTSRFGAVLQAGL